MSALVRTADAVRGLIAAAIAGADALERRVAHRLVAHAGLHAREYEAAAYLLRLAAWGLFVVAFLIGRIWPVYCALVSWPLARTLAQLSNTKDRTPDTKACPYCKSLLKE